MATTPTRTSARIDTAAFASLGPGQLRPGRELDALAGHVPQVVVTAREVEQVTTAITEARSQKLGIVVSGGATLLHVGNAPRAFDIRLATTALGRIVEQNPQDMTVCCEAGVTLARLQRSLAKIGQRVCIDAASEEKATIGGIVATNATGGLRYGFGMPRDLLLGLTAIDGCARTLKAGGRVVKNVAGYDLVRLLTGSWGTLAVVTDITLRTHPLPAAAATLVFDFASPADLDAARGRIFGANLPLAALDLAVDLSVDPSATAGGSLPIWSLIARVEGSEEEVAAQGDRLCALCGRDPADALEAWTSPAAAADGTGTTVRIGSEPADLVPALVDILAQITQRASSAPGSKPATTSLFVGGHLGAGIARLQIGDGADAAGGATLLRATEVGGRVRTRVVERAGGDYAGADVWAPLPASFALMRELKKRFDPDSVLAPGRFVGGL